MYAANHDDNCSLYLKHFYVVNIYANIGKIICYCLQSSKYLSNSDLILQ
jgi:hypothetical protein